MDAAWQRVAAHARSHHGTISWHAALGLGVSEAALGTWQQSGRLERVAPAVYVVAGTPPTWHQRTAVAVASTGGWASHRTAAVLWRFDGFEARQVEVVTPHGRRRKRDWIVHESRRLRGVDVTEVGGIPCTSVARTILDLAAVAHPFRVGQALDDACRRWPGALDAVAQRFLEVAGRGRRGTTLMRSMLDERLGRGAFVQSGFEALAVRLVRSIGLPEPALQHRVRDGDFVAYLDLAWPPIRFGLECNSLAFHTGKRAHEWDHVRRRRLKRLGWEIAEFTYTDIAQRAADCRQELREMYRAREGTFSRSGVARPAHSG